MSLNIVTSNTYEKKLTQEEVADKQVIITKQALKLFPKPWKEFKLKLGKEKFSTRIEAVSCNCMGPQKTHDHYWLRDEKTKELLEWKTGLHIKFEKIKENEYKLEII